MFHDRGAEQAGTKNRLSALEGGRSDPRAQLPFTLSSSPNVRSRSLERYTAAEISQWGTKKNHGYKRTRTQSGRPRPPMSGW